MQSPAPNERAERLSAYKTVCAIVKEMSAKLHADEASAITWAAEGLLLASSPFDAEVAEGHRAFSTLMADLATHRWAENGRTAVRLTLAFKRCAPQTVSAAA